MAQASAKLPGEVPGQYARMRRRYGSSVMSRTCRRSLADIRRRIVRKGRAIALVIAAGVVLANAPVSYVLDAQASDVSAKVAFFGISSKTAQFPNMTGNVTIVPDRPEETLIDVTIDANSLSAPDRATIRRLRGEKFFWVERYPTVRFIGRKLTMSDALTGTVEGELTARGITRPETLEVTFDQDPANAPEGQAISLRGQMVIDRRDYGMNAYQLVVGKKVTIKLNARMVPR